MTSELKCCECEKPVSSASGLFCLVCEESLRPSPVSQSVEEWDIGGDIGIQVAIMLDKTLPNKYSSSFLETIEQKVADIVNPKISRFIQPTLSTLVKEMEGNKLKTGKYVPPFDDGFNAGISAAIEVVKKMGV